jgi:hypothetical protein
LFAAATVDVAVDTARCNGLGIDDEHMHKQPVPDRPTGSCWSVNTLISMPIGCGARNHRPMSVPGENRGRMAVGCSGYSVSDE